MNKLALGTAQFGLDYGISNNRGRIPEQEVFDILDEANRSGIDILDTAESYGSSETVIGKYALDHGPSFKIVSKISAFAPDEAGKRVQDSLARLNIAALYGLLIHDFGAFAKDPGVWRSLEKLKEKGLAAKIGFSLYSTGELDFLLQKNIAFDIVQVPYSVFDRRFEIYFAILKGKNIEIHARSAFLQGLVFPDPGILGGYFSGIKSKLVSLHKLAGENKVPVSALCLNYVMLESRIDQVVAGVASFRNLKDLAESGNHLGITRQIKDSLDMLREEDENILLPSRWPNK
jgi:aryl-alcohol dehydrogenase-like predicted oxidoreductase